MDILTQFKKIVTISSPSGKEQEMSIYLQNWLNNNKFQFKIDSVGNIYAKNGKKGAPLLLCAHMDTVQPGENIKPIEKNGMIQTDGSTILGADNKVAIAGILSAIEELQSEKNIELLFTVKEETGGGVEFFPFKWIQAKQALIFDSAKPLGGIILGSPHIINFYIQYKGKSAHASTPQAGVNAFVPAFEMLSNIKTGALDEGETTINIGIVSGGTGINTVPNAISIAGEVRSYSKKLFDYHLSNIQKLVKISAKKYGAAVTFELKEHCSGYIHSKNELLSKKIADVYVDMGIKPTYYEHSGVSDANILNANGIKTYNLTDGVLNPHTTNEQISIDTLTTLKTIIKKCITQL